MKRRKTRERERERERRKVIEHELWVLSIQKRNQNCRISTDYEIDTQAGNKMSH